MNPQTKTRVAPVDSYLACEFSLALDPTFGIHSHKTLSSFKARLKAFLFSQYFHPN